MIPGFDAKTERLHWLMGGEYMPGTRTPALKVEASSVDLVNETGHLRAVAIHVWVEDVQGPNWCWERL